VLRKLRESHILFFVCVFSFFALCLTNGFADEGLPPILEFPTADGAGYIQGNAEYQRGPDRIIGTPDFEKMRDLPRESQDYQLGTKIGWFYIQQRYNPNRAWICTGFLVGPDLFMTNHHCIHDSEGLLSIAGARIYMDYYQERNVDPTFGGVTARVAEILQMDEPKDYALLRLDSPIGNTYGWLELDTEGGFNSSQSVKLISHPAGRSKEIVRRNTEIVDIPPGHPLEDVPFALTYLADSEGGSSGSPVFLRDGTTVIGIHHSAWTLFGEPHFNAGTLMSYIVPEIQQWLPSGPPTPPEPPEPPEPPPVEVSLNIYWTDTGTGRIQRANFDGSNVETLVQGATPPRDIAVDTAGGKMYWTNTSLGQIQTANLDGTNVENLITGLTSPTGIALAGGKLFWTDTGTGAIQRANLDGTNVEDLITGLGSPTGIALDPDTTGKVYWTDTFTGAIQCAGIENGLNQQDLVTGLTSPTGIALNATGNKVYWTDAGTGAIQCASLNGANQQDLVTGLVSPAGIALNVPEGQMHWADMGTGQIQRASLDGSNRVALVTGLVSPAGIAIGISQTGGRFRFNPSSFPDQTFTVGTTVSLFLSQPTGGTPPYTLTLTPELPAGLYFEPQHFRDDYGFIGGTPTTASPARSYTYFGQDAAGAIAFLTFTITVRDPSDLGRVDVNGDGVVDVADLVIVAMAYGTRVAAGTDLPADVNLDLVVNLLDLTLVAQAIDAAGGGVNAVSLADIAAALEGIAAAPNALSDGNFAYRNVAAALADAKLEKGIPETVLKALRQLLAEMEMTEIPESTALLPNYPNPFNPETWIPYHLATDAAVVTYPHFFLKVCGERFLFGKV
jgi:V8-like Glu-specific endopeptidase/DNA-binding beta-propeller fold protein YncE